MDKLNITQKSVIPTIAVSTNLNKSQNSPSTVNILKRAMS